jgi:selenocysteine lyase/cysteine desulfurase
MVLPIVEMVALCRSKGVEEIAVDSAHGWMLEELDVPSLGCDWWWYALAIFSAFPSTRFVPSLSW